MTLLNVLGVLGVLNVLNVLDVVNVLYVLHVLHVLNMLHVLHGRIVGLLGLVFFRCVLASLYEVVFVRPSDGRMDSPSVRNPFFLNAENEPFSQ